MKKIYTIIFCALLSSAVVAQTTKISNIGVGIKAGVNFATITSTGDDADEDEDNKYVTSFQIGGYADIPVAQAFSVQPGLTLTGKGVKFKESEAGDFFEMSTNIMYLEIPVNAVYTTNGFYIGAGPYAAFALSGKVKAKWDIAGDSGKEDEKVTFGSGEDEMKRSDFGVNILAGYQLKSGINFGLNYGLGLSNLANVDDDMDYAEKNRVISLTVGFKF